jgi:hypothetical protein
VNPFPVIALPRLDRGIDRATRSGTAENETSLTNAGDVRCAPRHCATPGSTLESYESHASCITSCPIAHDPGSPLRGRRSRFAPQSFFTTEHTEITEKQNPFPLLLYGFRVVVRPVQAKNLCGLCVSVLKTLLNLNGPRRPLGPSKRPPGNHVTGRIPGDFGTPDDMCACHRLEPVRSVDRRLE